MRRFLRSRPSGSTLLLSMILLTVVTLVGVAVINAASRDRENAYSKSKYDRVVACARAAQAKIWAEVAMYGPGYLTGTQGVSAITLADGTALAAPSHYDTATDGSVQVKDVTLSVPDGAGGVQLPKAANLSNTGGATVSVPQATRLVARCTDAAGRPYEVELAIRFAF